MRHCLTENEGCCHDGGSSSVGVVSVNTFEHGLAVADLFAH
jgi:hypothetical protein